MPHPTPPEGGELSLRLDAFREPVSGVLRSRHGPERRFEGWLELLAAVEEAIAEIRAAGLEASGVEPGPGRPRTGGAKS